MAAVRTSVQAQGGRTLMDIQGVLKPEDKGFTLSMHVIVVISVIPERKSSY